MNSTIQLRVKQGLFTNYFWKLLLKPVLNGRLQKIIEAPVYPSYIINSSKVIEFDEFYYNHDATCSLTYFYEIVCSSGNT